mmetsp:Transcript_12510/g.18363  ORF Transcript_12510/g.18363 Transcript_12510/m.18363 type:complete len:128 (+) Transcript_12510:166-549(+)
MFTINAAICQKIICSAAWTTNSWQRKIWTKWAMAAIKKSLGRRNMTKARKKQVLWQESILTNQIVGFGNERRRIGFNDDIMFALCALIVFTEYFQRKSCFVDTCHHRDQGTRERSSFYAEPQKLQEI